MLSFHADALGFCGLAVLRLASCVCVCDPCPVFPGVGLFFFYIAKRQVQNWAVSAWVEFFVSACFWAGLDRRPMVTCLPSCGTCAENASPDGHACSSLNSLSLRILYAWF